MYADRFFWIWQERHGKTETLTIDPEDNTETIGWENNEKGTSPRDELTPGQGDGDVLGMETPLYPFTKSSGEYYTSNDCVNIEKVISRYNSGYITSWSSCIFPDGLHIHAPFRRRGIWIR